MLLFLILLVSVWRTTFGVSSFLGFLCLLWLLHFLPPLFQASLSPEGKDLAETFPLVLSVLSLLLSACHLYLSVCSLLLQEEASLKVAPIHE